MEISVIIPLWLGADTIADCLCALIADSESHQCEIICVDNASPDASAAIVASDFPDVKLVHQPINLGFAGGVNAGMKAARGDLFVLLNQDCFVQPGWLTSLVQAFKRSPTCGIAGCTILNPDGTINHAGAYIKRPGAYGVHFTEIEVDGPAKADYVTGAAFAIHRATWEAIGPLDEDFYPAYYEESDYCYRARLHGFEIWYVPDARVSHIFSGREWQADPVKHTSNQHQSRFRFVSKHFQIDELEAFFSAEILDIEDEPYFDQVLGRLEAVRHTLGALSEIVERRTQDSGAPPSTTLRRQLSVGFADTWRHAYSRALRLTLGADRSEADAKMLFEAQRKRVEQLCQELGDARTEARRLHQQQRDLLSQIYLRPPTPSAEVDSTLTRLVRLWIKRPASILSGRDFALRSELGLLQLAYMEQTEYVDRYLNELLDLTLNQVGALTDQQQLLSLLTEYEYR